MATKGINKVILIGNLGNDPEIRFTASGSAIANLSIATSESWRDKQTGQQQEKTEWHRVVIFGKLAEIAQQYLRKGAKVYLEGKLQTRKWQDQQGNDRYSTEIVIDGFSGQLQMLDSRSSQQEGAMNLGGAQTNNNGQQYQQTNSQSYQGFNNSQNNNNPSQMANNQHTNTANNNYQNNTNNNNSTNNTQNANTAPQPAATTAFDNFDDDIPF